MKPIRFLAGILFVCAILFITCEPNESPNSSKPVAAPAVPYHGLPLCDPKAKASHLQGSLILPFAQDIPGFPNPDSMINFLQHAADVYSWETFIAMNWLADSMGNPDKAVCFGTQDGVTVWEHWMPSNKVMIRNGEMPPEWQGGLNSQGIPLNTGYEPALKQIANLPGDDYEDFGFDLNDLVHPNILGNLNPEAKPVVDQDKQFTLYEVFWNKVAYDYVKATRLYNQEGRKWFSENWPNATKGLTITTPDGDTFNIANKYQRAYFSIGNAIDSTEKDSATGDIYQYTIDQGSILIKSGWKPLSEEDDKSRYHVRKVIYENGEELHLGLVAFHAMHKVAEAPQWVWTTFEHIDVSPEMAANGELEIDPNTDYLYFNKAKASDSSIINKPPPPKDGPGHQYMDVPTQVVEDYLGKYSPDKVNKIFHDLIRKANEESVWLNYRLVGTQWPFDPSVFGTDDSDPQPTHLANALMETYYQTESSCLGCHQHSHFLQTTSNREGYFADYIWALHFGK